MSEALLTARDRVTKEPFPLLWDKDSGTLLLSGTVTQAIPDSEDRSTISAQWGWFTWVDWAWGDFVTAVGGTNWQSIVALSASPLTAGESVVVNTSKWVMQPAQMEFAGSFVRTWSSFATATLFANWPSGPDPVPAPINIVSCYQSSAVQWAAYNAVAGTIMHMTLSTPVPNIWVNNAVFIGDWINITGLNDNRMNYQNACINYISPDRLVIAVGFSDEAALPSLAIPVVTPTLGTAKVNFYNNMSGARNGFGLRFTGITATSAAVVSIFGWDDNQVSGSLLGDHRATISSSAPTYVSWGSFGSYELRASSRYLLSVDVNSACLMDKVEQAQTNWTARDIPRTSVKPSSEAVLYPRFRLYKPVNISRPIVKIVSAVKTGTTTATVTTHAAHGLVTGNWVTVKGARDVTNFAPLTVPVQVTVTGTTTFTIVWGGAVTATSYGWSVIIANWSKDQPWIIGQTVQSVVSRVAEGSNWLDVVGNTTWAWLNLGDYIDLHGVRSAVDGSDLLRDGAWEVAHIATTTLTLKPIFNISWARVSPALGTLISTNCGGTVILRPTLRSHDLSLSAWTDSVTKIFGQGTTRNDLALPVNVINAHSIVQGTAATPSTTTGLGGWYFNPANVWVVDIASAALTASNTTASIANAVSNAYQVVIPVTSVTGTTPTLDVTIQESDDGGTNWFSVYQFPRITAAWTFRSPVLPVIWRHIRYVQTVGWTTPSFTRSLIRNVFPTQVAKPTRLLRDLTFNVNGTLGTATSALLADPCNNLQLVLRMGTITTTAPALQLQWSDDGWVNWYSIGTPLTWVQNSTVQLTVVNLQTTLVRAALTTAWVASTLGEITLKAFS